MRKEIQLDHKQGLNEISTADTTAYMEPDSVILRDPTGKVNLVASLDLEKAVRRRLERLREPDAEFHPIDPLVQTRYPDAPPPESLSLPDVAHRAEERRQIEDRLFKGEILGVSTTPALVVRTPSVTPIQERPGPQELDKFHRIRLCRGLSITLSRGRDGSIMPSCLMRESSKASVEPSCSGSPQW